VSPKGILRTAKRRGLNAVAITDHNTMIGGIKASNLVKREKLKVMVIVGAEISTDVGDVIGLFISEEISSKNFLEVVDEIHDQDGLVLLPHPFRSHRFNDLREIINQVDLLEICNSRSPMGLEQVNLLSSLNKTLVGGSDAHFTQEIGLCKTVINAFDLDADEAREILLCPSNVIAYCSYDSSFFCILSQLVGFMKPRLF